jgi:hypothetical protein
MNYRYFLEDIGNKNIDQDDLDSNILYILCYHVETECKYPFLQFIMEKIPFCNNLIKEELVLPHIVTNKKEKIEDLALDKVKSILSSITNNITDDMYKGIIWCNNWYVLINISDIDLTGLYLSRNSSCWPVLPSEIINTKEVCGVEIDSEVSQLFIDNPRLGILTNPRTKGIYILPDAVYTSGDYKSVEFNAIFGNRKRKIYESCGEYFYFFKTFSDAINVYAINVYDINEESKDVCFKKGINRYALFIEGELYMEIEKKFSLTDDEIQKKYLEPCVIICYFNQNKINPDILVKECDNFVPISYHMIDMSKIDVINEKRII